ncbi:sensor histidine kinase [Pelosinus sp. sgz500959]|uniref:sensor histidine kinase n=1 Tax=Pelosinus sp. sgz500959 TaxID=3242472 RepID=UPI00366A74B0
MNITKMKWLSALFPALFIGIFEFVRHEFLHYISMDWGNLLVAVVAGILFLFYFHGIFAMLENLYDKLQKEKEDTAVLQERDRIAREIHDSVSQALFFMNVKVLEIETALTQKREPMAAVQELHEAIKLTDADIRQHIFALQKVTEENINLISKVQEHLDQFQKKHDIVVNLRIKGNISSKFDNQVKSKLLRILQELLLNIRKHAAATQVNVSLLEDTHQCSMAVTDNGKGFDVEKVLIKKTSFGLKNLKNDVRIIGATLDLKSSPGEGTTVVISLN